MNPPLNAAVPFNFVGSLTTILDELKIEDPDAMRISTLITQLNENIKRNPELPVEKYNIQTLDPEYGVWDESPMHQLIDRSIALSAGNALSHFKKSIEGIDPSKIEAEEQKIQKSLEEQSVQFDDFLEKYEKSECAELKRNWLHFAVVEKSLASVQLLKGMDVDLNERDGGGCTPLHLAVEAGNLDVIRYLLDQGVRLDIEDNITETPLHTAIGLGLLEAAKLLIAKSPQGINTVNSEGTSILHTAVEGKQTAAATYLVQAGCELNPISHNQKFLGTPLHVAVHFQENKERIDVLKILLQANVDLDTPNDQGLTPLHIALQKNNSEQTKLLLEKGANPNIVNKEGSTPLHLAVKNSDLDFITLLKEYGADPKLKNGEGKTALEMAKETDLSFYQEILPILN